MCAEPFGKFPSPFTVFGTGIWLGLDWNRNINATFDPFYEPYREGTHTLPLSILGVWVFFFGLGRCPEKQEKCMFRREEGKTALL